MTRIALIMLLVVCTFGCEKKTTQAQVEAERDKKQARREVKEFVSLHNAVTDWRDSIGDGILLFQKRWTVDVEEALVRPNGRPIAFACDVEDIDVVGGKHIVRFYDASRAMWSFYDDDIRFDLECSKEQIDVIRNHAQGHRTVFNINNRFVVVAHIADVHKVRFTISASSVSYSENAEIEVESPNVFIAKGRCVAVKHLSVPLLDLPQRKTSD